MRLTIPGIRFWMKPVGAKQDTIRKGCYTSSLAVCDAPGKPAEDDTGAWVTCQNWRNLAALIWTSPGHWDQLRSEPMKDLFLSVILPYK